MITTPILRGGRMFAFRVNVGIPIQRLCRHIARLEGVSFTLMPRSYWKFFRWSGESTSQTVEFTFNGHCFVVGDDVPWTGECWVGPSDETQTFDEIHEIQAHVDTLPLPLLHRPVSTLFG